MKINNFWSHPDTITESCGYGQFSKKHIILMISEIIFAIIYTLFYINCDISRQIQIRKIIAIILIIIEIIKMIALILLPIKFSDYLPLEICSFANYAIIFDSFFPGERILIQSLLTLFLPAAIMALVYPTTTTLPLFNFFTIHNYMFHELIIMYVIGCFINKEIGFTYMGYLKSMLIILILVLVIYIIDTIFKKNYMFLKDTYGNMMLMKLEKISGGGIKYTILLILFAIFVTNIAFLMFKFLSLLL